MTRLLQCPHDLFWVYVLLSALPGRVPLSGNGSRCYPAAKHIPVSFYGTYHWTSARPALLNLAATHCLCPLPSFFLPSFHSSACPVYFFSPFQISSITAECVSSALGNAHKMLDRLLTQRILSATTYSCSWPPGCVGCSILIPLFKYFCEHALLF